MNVSPANGGTITSPSFSIPALTYPAIYTCDTSYELTAVPNTAAGYKFDHWGGGASGTANPFFVSSVPNSVTAYFVLKTEPVTFQGAKNMIDGARDVLVLDVSSAGNYSASHLLCAKNYVWNNGGNNFSTSITGLTPYKNDDILIYEQNGANIEAAANYLAGQGFTSIYYMTDGLDDWIAEGYETYTTAEDGGKCTGLSPMAYAGTDQDVNENTIVTLKGQGSDPDGGTVTYAWSQVQGANNVSLSSTTMAQPNFTTPDLNGSDDTLIFHLTVTDDEGDKDTDDVTVNVKWNNAAPIANAGPDQTVSSGTLVSLTGAGSTDPENSIVSYQWTSASGTISPALLNASTVSPSFTAPATPGWVIYQLTVTDNGGLTDIDTVQILVQAGVADNTPPEANAGADHAVAEGQTVILDSSGSTDADGSIASRVWTQTGGTPVVTLPNPAAIKPVFTAPAVSASTVLTFTLTVTDDDGDFGTDTVNITVNDDSPPPPAQNASPTADAGKDQSIKEGSTVVLDSSGSSDSDGTIVSRVWTQTGGTPAVTLSNSGAIKPTFTAPDVENSSILTFSLVVTDDDGDASDADTVQITITKSSGGGGGGGGCFINSLAD